MRALLCLLALILISCSAAQDTTIFPGQPGTTARDIPVWLDVNFPQAERTGIAQAIQLWNSALNGHIFMYVESDKFDMEIDEIRRVLKADGFMFLRVDSTHPAVVHEHGELTLAWANEISGNWIYMIHDRIPDVHFSSIAAHELGHLFGIRHGGTYLMRAIYEWREYTCVDGYSARMAEKAQGLPEGSITYCDK